MKVTCIFFASRRYWPDEKQLLEAYGKLKTCLPLSADSYMLAADGEGMEQIRADAENVLVAVPMSGAVQPHLLTAAELFGGVLLYAAYVPGNAPADLTDAMLEKNAAPPVADCWSVLRRKHPRAFLAVTGEEAARTVKVLKACNFLRHAKLLLIGETEPWVVSAGRDLALYEKLGLQVEQISQEEIRGRYEAASVEDAAPYIAHFGSLAVKTEEPTEEDLQNACRMAFALVETLKEHHADGMAIACFKLLETGTNSCLGVSYINDCTPWIAACEGDLDSAVTMLMMKQLTGKKLWMANCGLHADGTMNFSHCTAPVDVMGEGNCPCVLRSHHESGIGVSLEVTFPLKQRVTACRVSVLTGKATVQLGTTLAGEREPVCRTQLYVRFDDPRFYLDSLLGCHQVFAFEDLHRDMVSLCGLLGFKVSGMGGWARADGGWPSE